MSTDDLPYGWTRVRFGDVVRNVNENSRDLDADEIDRVVGLDHLDPGSLSLARWDNLADLPDGTTFTRKFKPGQVLFGKRRAYQRKVAVPDFEGVCSGDILVFEPADKRMLAEFLPYLVQSDGFFDHALGTSAGSLSPRTKWAELARYEFALPPIDEQRRIAHLISGIDRLCEAHRQIAETIDNLEKSLKFSVCSEGEPVLLGELVAFIGGSAFTPSLQGRVEGDYPFVKVSDLAGPSQLGVLTTAANWITRSDLNAIGANVVPIGASIVQKVGASLRMKRVRQVETELCIDNNLLALVPVSPRVLPGFLPYLISTAPIESVIQEGAIPSLNQRQLSRLSVRIPATALQAIFLEKVSATSEVRRSNSESSTDLQTLRYTILNKVSVVYVQ